MALEKLIFGWPEVKVELNSQLNRHEKQCLPLYWTDVKFIFTSGSIKEGQLVFDAQKGIFITALTDYWDKKLDPNSLDDFNMIVKSANYVSEMAETVKILLNYDKIKLSEYK